MQFNENFVVKNGLEVSDNLLFADIDSERVGIGTTILTDTLTVYGGIAATTVSIAQTLTANNSFLSSLNVSGISTLGNITVGNGTTDLIVDGNSKFIGTVSVGSGIAFNPTTNTIISDNANLSGILTTSTIDVGSSINVGTAVTIDSSGVTANYFYGDGTGLFGIVNAGGMTIYYNGSPVGYAATILDFSGTGISTIPFSSGIATVVVDKPESQTNLIITGVTTIASGIFTTSLYSSGITTVENLYVTGFTSFSGLNVVGIATVESLSIGSTQVISSARELQNITSLDATTTATIESAIANAPNTFSDLNVTGVSTLGSVKVSSGIITSVSGIVTYYGDGSKLTGLPQQGIGIQSAGTAIGTGITQLNFVGSGNTFSVDSGTANISIQSGVSTQWQSINSGIVTTTKVGIGTTNPRYILEVGAVGMSVTTAYVNGDLNSEGLKVFGDATLNEVEISSGIITSTSGIVTYYGDGSNLTDINTSRIVSGLSSVTVATSGTISAYYNGNNVFNVTGTGVTMVAGQRLDVSSYSETVQTLGSSGSPISGTNALDIGTYSTFIAYVGTSAVTFTLTGAVPGRLSSWTLILIYTNSGTRNVSFSFGTLRYPGGSSSVTLSNTQVHDVLSFFTADSATNTYGTVVGLGFTV